MNKLKSTRIYGDLYIDGLAKVNNNDIITTTNLSSTIQTVSPNSLTTTENRSYSIQRNASGQLVVNIPWTDTTTNTYPTSFEWTDGTAAGPTGSLTGTGIPDVSFGAIPDATDLRSGVVTTDEQTFKGKKTFTDNVTLSGDLTVLGAMNVKNVNVLETSSGIIFEGGSGSGKVTMELATDPGTTNYSLKVPNKNGTIATDDIMTNTTSGLGKLFSDTVQSVAASTVSSTASRTYGIQRNSDNQLVVNVPWEDNDNKYSAGNGLTLSSNAFSLPVSTSGTGTFVTGITQLTNGIQVNLGTPPNTDTHWTSKNVVGGSSTASTNGTSTNGNTYINHIESGLSSPTSSHNIIGTGATTVTSDANGKITINSVDTKTNNYLTGVSGSGNGTVTFTRNGLSNLTWDASHTHDGDYTAVVNLTVATAAATAAKTTTETVTFQEGVIYFIRFTLGNSVSTVTLNGINMRLGTTNVSTTTMTLGANAVIPVYFDATANRLQITGSYRSSDATEAYTVRWNAAVKAGVEITRYKLLVQGEDNKYYPTTIGNTDGNTKTVSTVPFLIGAPILFYNTTTTVAANANTGTTSNYTGILTSSTARAWNQNSGWRAQEDVYLKGTISGSFFTLDNTTTTSHMTQDLPTTDDGFYYLRLGMMTNTTTGFKLSVEHPIYYFTNGELQLLAQQANTVKTYQKTDNVNYNIPFVLDLTDDEFKRLYTDNSAHLTYNPSTNALGVSGTIISTVATGTAPLVVASTTPVENLVVRWANVADKPSYNLDEIAETTTYKRVTQTEKNTWDGKQNALGYTAENAANKRTSIRASGANDTSYVSELGVKKYVDGLIGSVYRPAGDWNADTNSPTLANNTPANAGKVYRVSGAGTKFGFTFAIGDKLAFNESGVISKWDNVDDVVSVNGKTGAVVLTASDVGAAPTGQVVRSTTENKNILGTTESVFNVSEKKVWFNKGALFFGTAAAAGLVTRGISGTSPTGNAKDHLYINYDGTNTLSRQLVLGAGSIGTSRGHGIYDYSAVRGDAFIAYLNTQLNNISLTPGPKGDPGSAATVSVGTTTTGAAGTNASVTQTGTAQDRTFNFVIPRGAPGTPGTNGTNATISGATATVNNAVGTPGVNVTMGGNASARTFDFAFTNLKGAPGTNGTNGKDGLTTKINVNGSSYTQTGGTITLPNYPTVGNGTLTLNTSGSGISGSTSFTANQGGNTTFTVTSNATSTATANTISLRDSGGNITTKDEVKADAFSMKYDSTSKTIKFTFA